jgi:hypothetical protein
MWLELLLLLAVIVLVFQLFPHLPQSILAYLDFRQWSRSTWLFANLTLLFFLIATRIGPELVENWQSKRHAKPEANGSSPSFAIDRTEDVRVMMRRDEATRARLRRKFTFYAVGVPVLIVGVGALVGWWRGRQEQVERTGNSLLPDVECDDWRATEQGVVGIKVHVRPDRDVSVSQLGLFDANLDGLQLAHRVGILDLTAGHANKKPLIAEVKVPYGRSAPLQDSFRWVALEKPVTLQAGHDYILAAEALGYVEDNWPAMFKDDALNAANMEHGWNPLIVGDNASEVKELLVTTKPWPAVPDQPLPTKGGIAHGYANLIATPAN